MVENCKLTTEKYNTALADVVNAQKDLILANSAVSGRVQYLTSKQMLACMMKGHSFGKPDFYFSIFKCFLLMTIMFLDTVAPTDD